jgi:hypothetical protein
MAWPRRWIEAHRKKYCTLRRNSDLWRRANSSSINTLTLQCFDRCVVLPPTLTKPRNRDSLFYTLWLVPSLYVLLFSVLLSFYFLFKGKRGVALFCVTATFKHPLLALCSFLLSTAYTSLQGSTDSICLPLLCHLLNLCLLLYHLSLIG